MPINPNIAMGYQPPKFESPMNMMAQMMQIKGAQEASQLNALKLQQAQREVEQQNMLSQAYQSAFDPEKGTVNYNQLMSQLAGSGAGAQIPGILKGQRDADTAELTRQKAQTDLVDAKLKQSRSLLESVRTPEEYMAWHQANHSDPILGKVLASRGITAEQSMARIQQAIQQGPEAFQQLLNQSKLGTEKFMELNRPVVVSPGGSVWTGKKFETAPAAPEKTPAPPAMVAEYTFAKTPEGGGYVGSFEKFVRDRAIAARPPGAPAQPVAPTITTIVDPTDPTKMIAIDAKRYQGGGAGSPGVIGVSGKEPGAALRENKAEAGKTQLADDLDNLRASFQKLDAMRAIPSTERNVLSNIMSATGASGVGQTLGRATGTEAQVERDVINSARQRLVTSIKNATGMSAQQLNSNVELQTMLKSISDPGQSVQAAMRIIDDIEQAYVKGNGKLPKGNVPATPPAVVPSKAGGPAVPAKPGGNLSPAEQAELEQLRQRFRK